METIPIDGKTKIYGIIGHPVSHSFSPKMQTAAFQAIGENAIYLPFDIPENRLSDVLPAFRLLNIQGFNVTVPHKETILPFLDELSPEAKKLGSVNTVLATPGGWKGFSTDGTGFIRSLQHAGVDLSGKKVLLLGAGGSAKAISMALAEENILGLHLRNRTAQKAERLSVLLQQAYPLLPTVVNPSTIEEYDILINCTSVGMGGKGCPVEKEVIRSAKMVVDIIYNPPLSPLLELAIHMGIQFLNGLGMLLYQGVASFEIWTGRSAPIEKMETVLHQTLSI